MGLQHQVGIAEETTVGTYKAPTRFVEILPGETLDQANTTINSAGIRPGRRVAAGNRRELVRKDPRGRLSLEIPTTEFGLWLKHGLGTVVTSQPDSVNSPTVWDHTFTLGDPTGLGLTIQKGVEDTAGTVQPFALIGSKVSAFELGVSADEFAIAGFDIEAMDVDDTSALVAATYGDPGLFTYADGAIEIDDVAIATVKSASVSVSRGLNIDRRFLGDGLIKSEPKEGEFTELSGQVVAEFDAPATFWQRYRDDTSAKVELIFTGDIIEDAFVFTLHITLNDVRFGGQLPQIASLDVPDLTVPFAAFEPTTGDEISILYRTSDSTP